MASKIQTVVSELTHRGPHRVLKGDLSIAGRPGQVFTPASGTNLPAIAFGHHWMSSTKRYERTCVHLASWGIVVATSDTQRGPLPDYQQYATDLLHALDLVTHVRLGDGDISVHPKKLGLAGHGMGASVAILAAGLSRDIRALGALYPVTVSPNPTQVAAQLTIPGLIVDGTVEKLFGIPTEAVADKIGAAWAGPVVHRRIDKASLNGFDESRFLHRLGIGSPPEFRNQRISRALLTGFLLNTLNGDRKYSAFTDADPKIKIRHTTLIDDKASAHDKELVKS